MFRKISFLLLLVAFNNSSSNGYRRNKALASLGLPPTASQEDINKSCRKMLGKAHPDRKGGNAEIFIKINIACSWLSGKYAPTNIDDIFGKKESWKKWKSWWDEFYQQRFELEEEGIVFKEGIFEEVEEFARHLVITIPF